MDFQFCERLKSVQTSKQISTESLAAALSKDLETVKAWKDGTAVPEINELPDIATALNVSVDYLLTGEQTKMQKMLIGSPNSTFAYGRVTKSGVVDTLNQDYLPFGWKVVQTQLFVSAEGEDNILVVIEK